MGWDLEYLSTVTEGIERENLNKNEILILEEFTRYLSFCEEFSAYAEKLSQCDEEEKAQNIISLLLLSLDDLQENIIGNMIVRNGNATLLSIAVKKGYSTLVKKLLDKGTNTTPQLLLCIMAEAGELEQVQSLFYKNWENPNVRNAENIDLALSLAEKNDHREVVTFLQEQQFMLAVENKDIQRAQSLLERAEFAKDRTGLTGLHYAVLTNQSDMITLLLNAHPHLISIKSDSGYTALDYALAIHQDDALNDEKIIQLLCEKRADFNLEKYGSTALFAAIANNQIDVIEWLLQQNGSFLKTNKNEEGDTVLHQAVASSYDIHVIQLLIDNGLDVTAQNKKGYTALHLAIASRREDVAMLLLNHMTDFEIEDEEHKTVLDLAIETNQYDIIRALFKKMLCIAVEKGQLDKVESLFAKNEMYISYVRNEKNINLALSLAEKNGHQNIVSFLQDQKILLAAQQKESLFAAFANEQIFANEQTEIVRWLIHENINLITATDKNGDTALHLAVVANSYDLVHLLMDKLLEKGDLNAQNNKGQTALDIAIEANNNDLASILFHNMLDAAAAYGQLEQVQSLFNKSEENPYLLEVKKINSALAYAHQGGHKEICVFLKGKQLFSAIMRGEEEEIESLLDTAESAKDGAGNTALHIAVKYNRGPVVDLLLQKHPDLSAIKNKNGLTALDLAEQMNKVDLLEKLQPQRKKFRM